MKRFIKPYLTASSFLNPPPVFLEIGLDSLKVLRGDHGFELPLERAGNGKLSAACREKLVAGLQTYLGRKNWQPRVRAICGLSAHGVSLRKVALPAMATNGLENILRLQIEKEFPLSAEELAWGWRECSSGPDRREAVIAAVRKETIEYYTGILSAAGLAPEFTVAAFARELLCPSPAESSAVLDVGRFQAELASFENRVPAGLRILNSGDGLADAVLKGTGAKVIYLSGAATSSPGLADKLAGRIECRRLEVAEGEGFSSATVGLRKSFTEKIALLSLRAKPRPTRTFLAYFASFDFSRIETRRWAARAVALLAALAILPFAEPLVVKPFLAGRLAAFKNQKQHFVSVVDPELHFLQAVKQDQPPYLDAFYLFSKAAPPGLRLDSITINQHGEISLKAAMSGAQQVTDFRSKLMDSGFFANITVEEQTPVPFQQKVNVRMTAQWKSAASRAGLKIKPSADELAVAGAAPVPGGSAKPPPP